jgi:hypothetical protein
MTKESRYNSFVIQIVRHSFELRHSDFVILLVSDFACRGRLGDMEI